MTVHIFHTVTENKFIVRNYSFLGPISIYFFKAIKTVKGCAKYVQC